MRISDWSSDVCSSDLDLAIDQRPEIDRWIISLLNTLTREVDSCYADFEPTKAARAIQTFVDEHLSNWYVRLCRRRFWKGDYSEDKISAYQTLYTCLNTIAKRSEEHTSELQSLMRISYAVFCLKKKK